MSRGDREMEENRFVTGKGKRPFAQYLGEERATAGPVKYCRGRQNQRRTEKRREDVGGREDGWTRKEGDMEDNR